jgi:hypothetical protein
MQAVWNSHGWDSVFGNQSWALAANSCGCCVASSGCKKTEICIDRSLYRQKSKEPEEKNCGPWSLEKLQTAARPQGPRVSDTLSPRAITLATTVKGWRSLHLGPGHCRVKGPGTWGLYKSCDTRQHFLLLSAAAHCCRITVTASVWRSRVRSLEQQAPSSHSMNLQSESLGLPVQPLTLGNLKVQVCQC